MLLLTIAGTAPMTAINFAIEAGQCEGEAGDTILSMARCQKLRWLIVTALIAASCISSDLRDPKIEYRIAVIEGDPIGAASSQCRVDHDHPITYRYPSGRSVAIYASKEPVLTIPLNASVNVRVVDYRGSKSPGMQAVAVNVIPVEAVRDRASEVRRTFFRCDLLITVGGTVVGIERRGTDWRQRLPGGAFASIEDAERVFSDSGASLQRELPDPMQQQAQDEFWQWRREKDLWDFHCDAQLRETIRANDPKLYEALSETPSVDCQAPPPMPESGSTD
jgi:hypothetical protein